MIVSGDVGGSAKKMGMRIRELERLYGIEHGNNQIRTSNNFKSQEQLASNMGMTVQTLHNYKLLSDMIPEIADILTPQNYIELIISTPLKI